MPVPSTATPLRTELLRDSVHDRLRDAIVDGVTGTLVPTGDFAALGRALEQLLVDSSLRAALGDAAAARARASFESERVWEAWLQHYRARLANVGIVLPGDGQDCRS